MKTKITLMIALTIALVGGTIGTLQNNATAAPVETRKVLYYTCPMHPSVKADKPGDCNICGMKLVPVYADPAAGPAVTNAPATTPNCCSPGSVCH